MFRAEFISKPLKLFIFISLAFSSATQAYSPLKLLPDGHRASVILENNQTQQLSVNAHQLLPPASTLKIVTALAARLELPKGFHYQTTLEKQSQNIIFRFSGDPTLSDKDIEKLIVKMKQSGLIKIAGNIILENSIFSGYERGIGWPWDILGVCYSAPASAITVNGNCVQASISTLATGDTRVFVPKHQPITVNTTAKSVTRDQQRDQHCDLELVTQSGNQYQISGCLAERSKPLPLKFATQDTALYVQNLITTLLKKHKINFNGDFVVGNTGDGEVIATHQSTNLTTLIEDMLKDSNNLIADNLTKTLGAHFYQQSGSFASGTAAIKEILKTKADIDLGNARLADGSGLSRNNKMTASSMKQVLHYILENDETLDLINLMPIAGEEGTLKYRRSMRKAPIMGNIKGKSGSLYGSHNMAGFGLDANGQPTSLFVQFVSDYHIDRDPNAPSREAPITTFEKQFYSTVVKFSQ